MTQVSEQIMLEDGLKSVEDNKIKDIEESLSMMQLSTQWNSQHLNTEHQR